MDKMRKTSQNNIRKSLSDRNAATLLNNTDVKEEINKEFTALNVYN